MNAIVRAWGFLGVLTLAAMVGAGFQAAAAEKKSESRPAAGASVVVADLRCEYLSDSLGIDVKQPRLSWKLTAADPKARGQRQTAYQVLVSSRSELLAQGKGDLWDSGEVKSDQSLNVTYAGRPLASGIECFWKVRVRDERGALSAWSKPARWTMGLLEPADWKGKWIGAGQPAAKKLKQGENTLPDPWFRKTFSLTEKPTRATVYVASVGYHELYVNGKKIGTDVLSPCATDHTKRARYVTYEIADQLRPGKNAIGLWLGVSWSIYPNYKTDDKPQAPIVLAQAAIELPGGQSMTFATDESWKTHASPNTLLGVWNFMNFGGELYDANKEVADWCAAEFDDSAWKPAAVFSPKLRLSAEMVEPNRCVKEIRPVAIEERPGGEWRVDMGMNFAGWVEIDLVGKPGQRIDFQFSENEARAMTHRLRSAYILGPSGKGTFRNRFNYGVGRWITIQGLQSKPELKDIRAWLVRTDYRRAGEFECSNKLLNDIYSTTLWTFENLSLGGYVVDCPQRERMGYGGDGHATIETAMDNYDLAAFYTKWGQDWRDVQGTSASWGVKPKPGEAGSGTSAEDGNLPYTAPTYWGGGGPGWCGFCTTLPWQVYRRYGDTRILEENFPTIQRWLAFVESKSSGDLLRRYGGEWDFLGDWLWPGAKGVNGDTRETLFFNNCYWIYNLQTAAKVADAIGKQDAADAYRRRAESVRKAVHNEFFNPADNSYVNGFQAYLAIALSVGLPPEELRPAVWKRLEDEILVKRKGHIHAGITGGYFVIKTLLENGRDDLIFAMATKEDFPGWGDMLKRGATTMWESWEGNISLVHSSYLHIGAWFNEGLGGIRPGPDGKGYKSFVLKPAVLADRGLSWVKAAYESPYGRIASQWKVEQGKLRMEVSVPPNTTARLLLPTRNARTITENGRPAATASGVKAVGDEQGRAVLELVPGSYRLEAEF